MLDSLWSFRCFVWMLKEFEGVCREMLRFDGGFDCWRRN